MSHAANRASRNVSAMSLSAIMDMEMRAAAMTNVVSLGIGLPSFNTPHVIRQRVQEALESDRSIGKYTLSDGLPGLRNKIAAFHSAHVGINVDPERQVIVTAGNMQGLNLLLHTLLNLGDEVIVTDPGFASHVEQIKLCGGVPSYWRLDEATGWGLDLYALPGLLTATTKAIILISPSNPTGKIFAKAELLAVGRFARQHGLMLLLDDPYCHFIYENSALHFNLASDPELVDTVCYLYTFSKAHAMSGWRLGYVIVPGWMRGEILKVHDATLICAPRISQVAGEVALEQFQTYLPAFQDILTRRRELICARLDRVPHVFSYTQPEGAYYVFAGIASVHTSSSEFAVNLLDTAGVVVTPGCAFGPSGDHHVRMAYCVPDEDIEQAFDRIEQRYPG